MLTILIPQNEWFFHITDALIGFLPYMDIFLKAISTTSLVPKSLDLGLVSIPCPPDLKL